MQFAIAIRSHHNVTSEEFKGTDGGSGNGCDLQYAIRSRRNKENK